MRAWMGAYVRTVERLNHRVGRIAMYLIFAMMAVLLWSSFTKTAPFMRPSLWTLEVAQYLLVAYYVLGGPYSMQLGTHVRMDLAYGALSLRRKAFVDACTVFFLLAYLVFLFWGAAGSLAYSLGYFGREPFAFFADLGWAFVTGGPEAAGELMRVLERSNSAWRPYLWPVKLVFILGVVLMLLQAIAELFKDIERARTGEEEPFGPGPATGERA